MKNIEMGQKVKLATLQHLEFEVITVHQDGSCDIKVQLDEQNVLQYDHVAMEMLCVVHPC